MLPHKRKTAKYTRSTVAAKVESPLDSSIIRRYYSQIMFPIQLDSHCEQCVERLAFEEAANMCRAVKFVRVEPSCS